MADLHRKPPSEHWHGWVKLGPYRRRRAKLSHDERLSQLWLRALQRAVDRHAAGEPLSAEAKSTIPRRLLEQFGLVSELAAKRRATYDAAVADYIGELRTAGRDPKYLMNEERTLTAIGAACRWNTPAAINRDALLRYLEGRKRDGRAPRTLRNEQLSVAQFCNWLVEGKRIDADPLGKLVEFDTSERSRDRRALTPDEVRRLLAAAPARELIYRTALGTGLRHKELRLLTWGNVKLDDASPRLELTARNTKAKRPDVIDLAESLADRLRAHRPAGWQPADRVFRTVPAFETWEADCGKAGIPVYEGTGDNRVLVCGFHSLRTTFVSELHRSGASPRTIMQLARHRDYKLTATIYTDRRVLDTAGAVNRLPDYEPEPQIAAAVATGTDGKPADADANVAAGTKRDQKRDQLARKMAHFDAVRRTSGRDPKSSKTLRISGFSAGSRGEGKNSPSRTRTYNNPVNSRVLYH